MTKNFSQRSERISGIVGKPKTTEELLKEIAEGDEKIRGLQLHAIHADEAKKDMFGDGEGDY